ncbi:MAG: type I polyketide synthase, partial [Hyphomicrobiales bacterium]|nr:type I polyketide synthase [Hyphomicrobiales bacterium]
MADIRYLRDEVAIIGWSCRFPGANSVASFWSLLTEERCAVTKVPEDRFSLQRFGHPRRRERGKSYTWAAGIIDDVYGFDPAVFGISPREAEQMDPQQRILLELTWEALEDANIRPSSIAGSEVGVFIGASQTDYAHALYGDQAIADSHFATGNALAILANRISYIYDLRGPSVTVDTACSSSLVALHQAVEALRGGRIDTAIVGGINIIGSAAEFISFSQAQMLSPTGLCRAFSADADGYVRAEGGAVIILRRGAETGVSPVHGVIVASGVNSDGRTSGISLPSEEGQESLLRRVYARSAIDPNRLAFLEAHGTGTPVGDPIEAAALGHSLGTARTAPLPIGSVKSNIGHLEAASGLAGLLKAALALNHGILPRSLHADTLNPNIDFRGLNLALCQQQLPLSKSGQCYAGINSFGFGGTNAHAVIAPGKDMAPAAQRKGTRAELLALSAGNKAGLIALAQKCLDRIETMPENAVAPLAGALAHRRDRLATSLAIATTKRAEATEALHAFIAGTEHPLLSWGDAAGENLPVGFVYSGNGSQWPGMGIAAYRHNPRFRAHFDELDEHFQDVAGWSLKQTLFKKNLVERLPLTRVAQPLIFAIQSAATAALRDRGLKPAVVLGHSVGEVAAAEAAGILDLRTAVEVIHFRSTHQELVRGFGRMAALLAPADVADELVAKAGAAEIAAFNSPHAITVSGSVEALATLKKMARARSIPFLDLDLDYPFHTALMAPVEKPLLRDLEHITPHGGTVPFISTVTGDCVPGMRLNADYWWRNIRAPVQFSAAVNAAAALNARFFVEIGPRGTLLKHIADTLAEQGLAFAGLSVLDRNDPERDAISTTAAKAWISGAELDATAVFGPEPEGAIALPSYPWQHERYHYTASPEAIGVSEPERHPFSGARHSRDGLQWFAHIDTTAFPALADHRVGQQVIFPGAGFLEIVFAVAREWLRSSEVSLADFDILKPLDLTNGETREIMTRVSPDTHVIEVFSRPRLSSTGWLLHYRGRVLHSASHVTAPQWRSNAAGRVLSSEQIYRIGDAC